MSREKITPGFICDFCNKSGEKTKEHYFPQWMRETFPIYKISSANRFQGKFDTRDVGTQYNRTTCKKCNESWMSDLQKRAKPIIQPKILLDYWKKIDNFDAEILSRWCVMTSMTFDRDKDSKSVFTEYHRSRFKENLEIPDGIAVYASTTWGDPTRGVHHHPAYTVNCSSNELDLELRNSIFGILIGKFFISLKYDIKENECYDNIAKRHGVMKIYPDLWGDGTRPYHGLNGDPRVFLDALSSSKKI